MPNVLVLYHFLSPDDVVSARLLTELATGLAARGWNVKAVCSNRACHDADACYPARSTLAGVQIRRLWQPRLAHGSGAARVAGIAWMLARWTLHALRDSFRPDVVILGTDPPLSVLLAPVVKRVWPAAKVAHWCFDLYPEAAIADGLLAEDGMPVRMLRRALKPAYGSCDLIADIGGCMRSRLSRYGSRAVVSTLTPWALEEPVRPLPVDLEERFSLFEDSPLALLYSGSLGRAHSVEPVLRLARTLAGSGVRFAFTVRGAGALPVDANITVGPFASQDRLRARLAAADVHIVTLKPEWTGAVVPSKFFGAIAAGRPVLFFGSPDSAIANWIREYRVGWTVDPGAPAEIAPVLSDLARAPAGLQPLFAHCHAVYRRHFSRSVIVDRWDTVLRASLPAAHRDAIHWTV